MVGAGSRAATVKVIPREARAARSTEEKRP
jgi:hypothetical protein